MHLFRLIGLVLFITTAFLAMASAVTQTTHIRFKRPTRQANRDFIGERSLTTQPNFHQPVLDRQAVLPPDLEPSRAANGQPADGAAANQLQFISVPVVYPLLISGTLGLMMWFGPASLSRPTPTKRKRRR